MGQIARAFKDEQATGQASAGVDSAAKVHTHHGERDAHRAFRRFGLTLKVATSELSVPAEEGEPSIIPHLKVVDLFACILEHHPKALLGGMPIGESSQKQCQQFWERFKLAQPDHKVFETYPSREDWKTIIPLCLHGDKGRGMSKLPCYVFSWEPCIGVSENVRQKGPGYRSPGVHGNKLSWSCAKRKRDQCPDLDEPPGACESCPLHHEHRADSKHASIPHNGKGHSFLSKFLFAAIPHKVFKNNDRVVPAVLDALADGMLELFTTGVQQSGLCFRAAVCGIKGDLEFHHEAAVYDRCYATAGTVNNLMMCPQCHAGTDQFPYTDVSDSPAWASTCHASLPWSAVPRLSRIPFSSARPAAFYRFDIFHCLKFGILKDLAACVLIELSGHGMFDSAGGHESKGLPARLERAHMLFKLWCVAEHRTPSIRKFTKGTLHVTKKEGFPFLSGKGSDAVLCCMFLLFFVRLNLPEVQDPDLKRLLKAMEETFAGALDFIGVHHSHQAFLKPYCAKFLHVSGMKLLRGYAYLASRAIQEGKRLYSLRPKLHYYHHVLIELEAQIRRQDAWCLNPALFGCESNEDYIGRISRISRKVSPKATSRRTLDRYLVAVKLMFRKHGL